MITTNNLKLHSYLILKFQNKIISLFVLTDLWGNNLDVFGLYELFLELY